MQTQEIITLFGTVSNSATSCTSKNGRKYTAFGVSMIYDRNRQEFSYNVVAWGSRATTRSLSSGELASSSSFRHNPNLTTLPVSHYSPQPSCAG